MSTSELGMPAHSARWSPAGTYPPVSKVLHWLTAAFAALLVGTGVIMKQLGDGPIADQLFTLHKTAGALALTIIIARLGYRLGAMLTGRWPRSPGAHAIHSLLYAVMLLVPLLGWAAVSDFGSRGLLFGLSLPAIWPEGTGYSDALFKAHAYAAFGLLALVSLHIGIALELYVKHGTDDLAVPEHCPPAPSVAPGCRSTP